MCDFCELKAPLDSLASKWLFDYPVDLGVAEVSFGAVIAPERKQLDISVVPTPVIDREILSERVSISYCPVCGRKITGGAVERHEAVILESFLEMYDGNIDISVVTEDGEQLCAVQEIDGIKHDLWYEESKHRLVTSFKMVPDNIEDENVILLITVK